MQVRGQHPSVAIESPLPIQTSIQTDSSIPQAASTAHLFKTALFPS